MKQICGDCLHYNACAAWNIGNLANTEAGSCVNFEHIHLYDSVEVVRCKDCRFCMEFKAKSDGFYGHCRIWITRTISDYAALVDADGYCSYGERKEGRGGTGIPDVDKNKDELQNSKKGYAEQSATGTEKTLGKEAQGEEGQ